MIQKQYCTKNSLWERQFCFAPGPYPRPQDDAARARARRRRVLWFRREEGPGAPGGGGDDAGGEAPRGDLPPAWRDNSTNQAFRRWRGAGGRRIARAKHAPRQTPVRANDAAAATATHL